MIFEHTPYLWCLAVVPPFIGMSIRSYCQSRQWLYGFAGQEKKLGPYLQNTLLLSFTIIALTLALAKPKIAYKKIYFNRAGIAIALGIDISKSMLAEDVAFPAGERQLFRIANRLNYARWFAMRFLAELHGESIGAFIFADEGIGIVPLTTDYAFSRYILKHINDVDITVPGSDLANAITTGVEMLQSTSKASAKYIILISDGEDIGDDVTRLYAAAQQTADQGIKIFTVGIGSDRDILIPIRDRDGTTILNYYTDEDGNYLKTRLVHDTLEKIASTTAGQYFRLSDGHFPQSITKTILRDAEFIEETKGVELVWFQLSPVLQIVGLVLFVIVQISPD
jgi:Ca-activated chloride channel family protein